MRLVHGKLIPLIALASLLAACTSSGESPASTDEPTAVTPAEIDGRLVFADAGDVWVYAGTKMVQLTSTAATDSVPRWSPDGDRIVFSREEDGSADLFTMNADGSDQRQMTATPQSEDGGAWSPDGLTIGFSTFDESEGGRIWVMNADGTGAREIYAESSAFVGFQDWSPDGRSVLIGIDRDGGGEIDLYAISVDGAELTQLTTTGGDDSGGRWHPDGKELVFWSDGNPAGPGIYLMAGDGSEQRKILEDTLYADTVASAWSPDGGQIAWTAKFEGGGGSPIFVMNADGTGLKQVSEALTERTSLDWVD